VYVKAGARPPLRSAVWNHLCRDHDTIAFDDKRAALLGAFINRFAIGVVIGVAALPVPGWLTGLLFGLLLSLPDAIITKAYAPIIGLGAIGGLIIGFVVSS
jgi:hypothetical protein